MNLDLSNVVRDRRTFKQVVTIVAEMLGDQTPLHNFLSCALIHWSPFYLATSDKVT